MSRRVFVAMLGLGLALFLMPQILDAAGFAGCGGSYFRSHHATHAEAALTHLEQAK